MRLCCITPGVREVGNELLFRRETWLVSRIAIDTVAILLTEFIPSGGTRRDPEEPGGTRRNPAV